MDDEYAICATCNARVPMDMLAEHLSEHHLDLTAEDVRNAPVIDLTEDEA